MMKNLSWKIKSFGSFEVFEAMIINFVRYTGKMENVAARKFRGQP